jgi:WD40 repeat protein
MGSTCCPFPRWLQLSLRPSRRLSSPGLSGDRSSARHGEAALDDGPRIVRALIYDRSTVGEEFVASAREDGTIRFFDAHTGVPMWQPIRCGQREIWTLAYGISAQGENFLASGGGDGSIRLWDIATGQPIPRILRGHFRSVSCLSLGDLGRDENVLASGGQDGTIQLWRPLTGEAIRKPIKAHKWGVSSLSLSSTAVGTNTPDFGWRRRRLALLGCRYWRTGCAESLHGFRGSIASIAVARSAGGRQILAAASWDGTVQLWDAESRAPVGEVVSFGHNPVLSVSARSQPNGEIVVAACSVTEIQIWIMNVDMEITRLDRQILPGSSMQCINVLPEALMVGCQDGVFCLSLESRFRP